MSADPTDANRADEGSSQRRRDRTVLEDGGGASTTVDCLDATVSVRVGGALPDVTLRRAGQVARELDGAIRRGLARLDGGEPVRSVHVARLVERAIEYHGRTDGTFDVRDRRGEVRAYAPGDDGRSRSFDGEVADGDGVVFAGVDVDLGALPLAYALDRVAATLWRSGRPGRATAPGMATSAEGTGIDAPGGHDFGDLSGDWSLATTADGDPADRLSLTDGDVVVIAERDCTEAVTLRSLLAGRRTPAVREFVADWDGAAALVVQGGVVRTVAGFDEHLD